MISIIKNYINNINIDDLNILLIKHDIYLDGNELNILYGHSDYDLIVKPEDNADSSAIYCRIKECTLGNLITDAIKDLSNTEMCIMSGGSIRDGDIELMRTLSNFKYMGKKSEIDLSGLFHSLLFYFTF